MGKGLIPADLETWKPRRRAIVPAFHKAYLEAMARMFCKCTQRSLEKFDRMTSHDKVAIKPRSISPAVLPEQSTTAVINLYSTCRASIHRPYFDYSSCSPFRCESDKPSSCDNDGHVALSLCPLQKA